MTVHQPDARHPRGRCCSRHPPHVYAAGAGTLLSRRREFPAGLGLAAPPRTRPSAPESPPPVQTGKMAGSSEPVVVASRRDEALAAETASQALVPSAPREDFRVRCTSKRAVTEILELCGRFVQNLGDALPAEIREAALRDVQWVRSESAAALFTSLGPQPGPRGSGRLPARPWQG